MARRNEYMTDRADLEGEIAVSIQGHLGVVLAYWTLLMLLGVLLFIVESRYLILNHNKRFRFCVLKNCNRICCWNIGT